MKGYYFLTFIFLFPLLSVAQNPITSWSSTMKKNAKSGGYYIYAGDNDGSYYVISKESNERKLIQLNQDMELVKEHELPKKHNGIIIKTHESIQMPNADYLIFSVYDKSKGTESVWANRLGKDGSLSENIELFSYSYKGRNKRQKIVGYRSYNSDKIGSNISSDSSKIVFTRVGDLKEKGGKKEKYFIFVFDQNLKKLWETVASFPFKDDEININQFGVSNSGEVSVFVTQESEKGGKNVDHALYKITESGQSTETIIKVKESLKLTDSKIHFNVDGSIYFIGFYEKKDKKKKEGIEGIYFSKYDADYKLEFEHYHKIDKKLKDQLLSDYDKKMGFDIFDYWIDNIFVDEKEESILFVAEGRTLIDYQTVASNSNAYPYYMRSILVSCFTFDGEVKWMTPINKVNSSFFSNHNTAAYYEGNIYLIYHYGRYDATPKAIKKNSNPIVFTKLDSNGENVDTKILFEKGNLETMYLPDYTKVVDNNKIYMFGNYRKKFQIGMVDLR